MHASGIVYHVSTLPSQETRLPLPLAVSRLPLPLPPPAIPRSFPTRLQHALPMEISIRPAKAVLRMAPRSLVACHSSLRPLEPAATESDSRSKHLDY